MEEDILPFEKIRILKKTLFIFILTIFAFIIFYYPLSLGFFPEITFHTFILVIFSLISLSIIFSFENEIIIIRKKLYLIFVFITLIVLTEELLLISPQVTYGFLLTISLVIFIPFYSVIIAKDQKSLQIAIEAIILILLSRIILIPFPINLLNFPSMMPIIYSFLIFSILVYIYLKKIKNEEIRLHKGNASLSLQILIGILVGLMIGVIEFNILKPEQILGNLLLALPYILMIMILVGFAEEIIFRGIFQTYLEKIMNKIHAILIASLIFGIMHTGWLNPLEVVLAYSAGLVFGILAFYFNSLTAPITAHTLGNVVLYLIPFI